MLSLVRRDCSSELTQHVGVAYISGVLADGLFGQVLANRSHLLCHQQQVRRLVLHKGQQTAVLELCLGHDVGD